MAGHTALQKMKDIYLGLKGRTFTPMVVNSYSHESKFWWITFRRDDKD